MGRLKLVNFLLFQVGWLVCVLGAARGLPWIGILYGVPALALHLSWARRAFFEFRLIFVCVLAGLVFDSLLLASGWVSFPNGWWIPGAAPYWMSCLWLLFGTTLNLSMAWLHSRPIVAAVFGAVGGPLAYLAGERLGGISLVAPIPALVSLALGWAAILPFLNLLASRWNGFGEIFLPDYIFTEARSKGASRHA